MAGQSRGVRRGRSHVAGSVPSTITSCLALTTAWSSRPLFISTRTSRASSARRWMPSVRSQSSAWPGACWLIAPAFDPNNGLTGQVGQRNRAIKMQDRSLATRYDQCAASYRTRWTIAMSMLWINAGP